MSWDPAEATVYTIEFFNLVLETKLTQDEKNDLLAFLYTL
jgi:hypothetical protein